MQVARFYGDRGITLSSGYMQYVWDTEGRRYIDAHTGHGVAFLGHSNPRIMERVKETLTHAAFNGLSFKTSLEEEALEGLSKIAPSHLDTVIFQNTGSEAVEAALKLAWAHTGKTRIVAFKNSFHGRTLGALSVTWNPRYRRGFPVLAETVFAPYNAGAEELSKHITRGTAAVIVEPIQGEGGVVPGEPSFLKTVEKLARESGALLIVDEVQTGYGRTGRTWSHMKAGIEPDILLAGKAVGGGVPVSLVMTRSDIAVSLKGGRHGSTHAGNPLALAAAAASSRLLLEDDVASKAAEKGALLKSLLARLAGHAAVRSIRGEGLMLGVELRFKPEPILKCLQARGVLALKAGLTVVRLLPPYMITREDIQQISTSLGECIGLEHSG